MAARIPCSLTRAYNHQDATTGVDRPFGPSWFWQYDMNLTGTLGGGSGTVTWKSADGSEYDFTYVDTSGGYDNYSSPAGMHEARGGDAYEEKMSLDLLARMPASGASARC